MSDPDFVDPNPGGGHTNPTPDLNDEQYMEQLILMAQCIAVMPGITDQHPNATTPPPIRPRWAKYLISLGFRLHPEMATHRVRSMSGHPNAGAHGPQQIQAVSEIRKTMNREDLFGMWRDMNPESYHRVMNGTMTREELWNMIPDEIKQAAERAEQMRGDDGHPA